MQRRFIHPRAKGSSLIFMVAFLVVLLGFLGMAIYTGLNAYVQNELQSAVNTSSMVGASAFYDGDVPNAGLNPRPKKDQNRATQAATATFNRIIAASDMLTNLNAQISAVTPNPVDDSVRVEASATIPTPFLSLMGVDSFQVSATGKARYVKFTMANPGTLPGGFPGAQVIRIPNAGTLQYPVVDGPGPDLKINFGANPKHGFMIEACTNSASAAGAPCTDISPTAVGVDILAGDRVVYRSYPHNAGPSPRQRRVLYGNMVLDLGATNGTFNYGPNATNYARKASFLKIIDDGVPDHTAPVALGSPLVRQLYLTNPPGSAIASIDIYHLAVSCPPTTSNCSVPAGMNLSAMGAGDSQ